MNKLKSLVIVLASVMIFGCASAPLEEFSDIMTEEEKDRLLCKRVFKDKKELEEHLKKGYCISK